MNSRGSRSPLSDLLDVATLVGKGLVGELTDADLRRHDTEPAPPPSAVEASAFADCPRCEGAGEVVRRTAEGAIVVQCPVCAERNRR